MTRPLLYLISVVILWVPACGGEGGRSDAAARPETASSMDAGGGGSVTTIHVVVGGGQHAGTYDAKSGKVTCTYGFAGPGSWGNQHSDTGKKPNELSSLQLIVPDTKDAADGTDKFQVTVGFGELLQPGYTEYTIQQGSEKGGSGSATVEDRGKTGKVRFKGKTADGVTLEGTIDCHQVMRGES